MAGLKKNPTNDKTYWRSLNELAETPGFREFVKNEFPNNAFAMLQGPSRRKFLQLMGASFAFAGLSGCRWPKETIVPYSKRPEHRTPGVPQQYTTVLDQGGVANGLLITSYDGRPIKVEGNPDHPMGTGAADAYTQAAILELYDPDRLKTPLLLEQATEKPVAEKSPVHLEKTWDDFAATLQEIKTLLSEAQGEGFYLLTELASSPSVEALRTQLATSSPKAKWLTYEPLNCDAERQATIAAFGAPHRIQYNLKNASVVVSLDCDFFATHPQSLQLTRDFMDGRSMPEQGMNRLYVAESRYSITGSMADHRLALRSQEIEQLVLHLAAAIAGKAGAALPESYVVVRNALQPFEKPDRHAEWIEALAQDLVDHIGKGAVLAGPGQSVRVHALVLWINEILGNLAQTVNYIPIPPDSLAAQPSVQSIRTLVQDAKEKKIKTLLILGGDPLYTAPADLDLATALAGVSIIHLTPYKNHTSLRSQWVLPRSHFLEAWGDGVAYDGTVSIAQPLIAPLYESRSALELLSMLLDETPRTGYAIVRRDATEADWKKWLYQGFIEAAPVKPVLPPVKPGVIATLVRERENSPIPFSKDRLEVTFQPDAKLYDGRYGNNAWLQELPDPQTKITWDNAALISPQTAAELKIQTGDLIEIRDAQGKALEIVAYVQPGQADYSIALTLGYGQVLPHLSVGNQVGFNTYRLRTSSESSIRTNLTIQPLGKTYPLACTQDHHAIDEVGLAAQRQRLGQIVQEKTLDEYLHPHDDHHGHPPVTLWKEHEYNGHKWGMAIDLNRCNGCNACVVACQAENNIPVVGKQDVMNGREMHWIRIDRYYKGKPEDPTIVHQPMNCSHCENAPCEQVCPVAATVHSSEGLNTMVYNRCVGTRYCSNNCPFKVRRFNFFNYHKNLSETEKMLHNPEVTVRSRGVMEKCTYCVQRIETAKIQAKNEGRSIQDGEVVPACAQTCPTKAITFGDLNDPNSQVAKAHQNHRAYFLLNELNLKARTAYMARIRNLNPRLEKHESGQHA